MMLDSQATRIGKKDRSRNQLQTVQTIYIHIILKEGMFLCL